MYDLEELAEIIVDGMVDVECSAGCGECRTIEPDGDYSCSCGRGRLVSPLILEGLI